MLLVSNIKHPVIFFDGHCKLCNFAVNFIISKDKDRMFRYAFTGNSIEWVLSDDVKSAIEKNDTIVLLLNDKLYTRSSAILIILRKLGGWPSLLSVFIIVPKPVRDWIYSIISDNRASWFGRYESCLFPGEEETDLFISGRDDTSNG